MSSIKTISLKPYDPSWPALFEYEADILRNALKEHCLAVHHVGSTSVPGLTAKEDIDICCVIDNLENSLLLQDIDYIFKGELNIPLRNFFSKNTNLSKVNLHVVETDHAFLPFTLCFRDYLREHPESRSAYGTLKQTLANDSINFERIQGRFPRYTLEKHAFINNVLDKAHYKSLNVVQCIHYREWEAYHRIRAEQIFARNTITYDPNHPTITADGHFHLVLLHGTQIVSVAHVEFLKTSHYEKIAVLRSIATDEPYKGKGYGRHFMGILERWLKYQGKTVLIMHAHPSAIPFYEKLGYTPVPVEQAWNDPCITLDFIDMWKLL